MLKWTVAGQRGGGTAGTWRRASVQADESPTCFAEKPARRRRRPSSMSGRFDKENSLCADVTPKTCRNRRRESLRDVSNHNSPAAIVQMSPGDRRTKSPCTETHWMPMQKRRSGDDIFRTDDRVKRKKPCTADHVIVATSAVTSAITTTATATVVVADEPLCVSMSPTEEPVQLSHKQLPAAPTQVLASRARLAQPDDLRASRLIDRFVDQICMDDGTFTASGGDRLSIVSPLAKRLADIRLRRSPTSAAVACSKRKRPAASSSPSFSSDDDSPHTPAAFRYGCKRPAARWWQRSGGGGGGGGLTLPDGLPSPFDSSHRHHHSHRLQLTVPPSPITPLRRHPAPDDSDDYWKTPVGPSLIGGVRAESLLSTASSKTADDEIIRCPRSPAALDETFTLKSRRCLSFVSPPPSDRKKNRRSLPKKATAVTASVDKASGLEVSIGLKDLTHLNVLLKRGRNLVCADGEPPNTYIKVYLVPGKGTCHRTRVRHNSSNPRFDESFSVPLTEEDHDKRILISAWHRDKSKRRSEFLGYMSFAVKNVVKKEINGTFKIVPQSPGRMPPHSTPAHRPQDLTVAKTVHSTDDEEDIMIDDEPTPNNRSASTKVKNNEKSKKDVLTTKTAGNEENKFLQYLELDPPLSKDGKGGKTPFTVTKRLSKSSGSSFGFSIAWTHPPRVERVECGLPADQAELKPGDYVVFINKTNVVMMAEDDVMNLIKSCGNQLSLEVYNRTTTTTTTTGNRRNQPPPRSASIPGVLSLAAAGAVSQSDTTVSLQEPSRRRFHIPQVTFTSENLSGDLDSKLRWIHQLLTAEQQFVLCLQFGIGRYLLPLAERRDVLKSKEHATLFQNVQELLRTTEDTLEQIIENDWKMLARNTCKAYVKKIDQINGAYYKYCKGIIHADCVLVDKVRNQHFLNLIKDPPIPDRRPDLLTFIHKPLEHYRNLLKCMQLIQINTEHDDEEFEALSHIVHEMQATYRFITIESGLMEPEVDGKPLLSLNDLESRLVFTRCKPFTLNTPDRQWIFAGDLSRVEGRSTRSYWVLLFSDILLFTKVSRDRVLFVTDEPLPLSSIAQTQFSVKKKDTEFRLVINSGVSDPVPSCHSSPAMTGCSPLLSDLSGTLSRLPKHKGRVIVLRAPKSELKAVWQNLIQRQILALEKNAFAAAADEGKHCNGGPASSADAALLDSPDDLLANSLATLDDEVYAGRLKTFTESLVDERCRRMAKNSACNTGKALHISQWMKGELGVRGGQDDEDDGGGGGGGGAGAALELWPAERMDAVYAEIQRRLAAESAARDGCGGGSGDGGTTVSDDCSQRTVVPEDARADDVNGNCRQFDPFLDADANRKTRTSRADDDDDVSNNNGRDIPRVSSPPRHRSRYGRDRQQPQARLHPWRSSTSSLDRTDRDHSSDSLDKVEFCSTADYRLLDDFCPVTASCCLPTDDDYNYYDASSEEFWGTPNSSTTSPLSFEVNCNEERQKETVLAALVDTSSTPQNKPVLRLEPLIEEFESLDNTPTSYEHRETLNSEGQTLLNFEGVTGANKDKHRMDKSTTKNLFNVLWRTTRGRTKRTCSGEFKSGTNFIRRRRIKFEKSKENKEIKLNLIESVYLLIFG